MSDPRRDTKAKQSADGEAAKRKAKSKAGWVVVIFMMAVIGGLVAYNPEFVTDLFDSDSVEPMPSAGPGETTALGFLEVACKTCEKKAKVILDGEILGPLPIVNRLVRTGEHRLQIRSKGGKFLVDQRIKVAPGDKLKFSLAPSAQ
jgi:hypothetical protein